MRLCNNWGIAWCWVKHQLREGFLHVHWRPLNLNRGSICLSSCGEWVAFSLPLCGLHTYKLPILPPPPPVCYQKNGQTMILTFKYYSSCKVLGINFWFLWPQAVLCSRTLYRPAAIQESFFINKQFNGISKKKNSSLSISVYAETFFVPGIWVTCNRYIIWQWRKRLFTTSVVSRLKKGICITDQWSVLAYSHCWCKQGSMDGVCDCSRNHSMCAFL